MRGFGKPSLISTVKDLPATQAITPSNPTFKLLCQDIENITMTDEVHRNSVIPCDPIVSIQETSERSVSEHGSSAGLTSKNELDAVIATNGGTVNALTVHGGSSLLDLNGSYSLSDDLVTHHANELSRRLRKNNGSAGVPNTNRAVPSTSRISTMRSGIRRVSSAFVAVGESVTHVGNTVEQYLDPETTGINEFMKHMLALYLGLQVLAFLLCLSQEFPTLVVTTPISMFSMLLMAVTIHMTDASTRGERALTVIAISVILMASCLSLVVVTRPCTHCIYYWASDAWDSSQDFSHFGRSGRADKLGVAWNLLLSPHDDEDGCGFVASCRKCVSSIFVFLIQRPKLGLLPSLFSGSEEQQLEEAKKELEAEELKMFNIQPYQTSDSMFGDLASWYLYHSNRTQSMYLKQFNAKFATALSQKGHFDDDLLTNTLAPYFCSPASRFDNPDPNRFLADLRNNRFTGEPKLNISATTLKSIMRGDVLHELGVSICFMLRFALLIQEDHQLENQPTKYTNIGNSTNEEGMKSVDYSHALPFLVTPGLDQDIDPKSVGMKRFQGLMDIYTRFPFQDEPLYFKSKQEYYAFYRWQVEGTLQDEWYFPRWFLQTEKGPEFADFMAKKLKVSNDYLVLQDPTSDRTLGDRCFYGTGQRFLTPAKFPGINEDYEYLFPGGPDSYMTQAHNDKFRFTAKPKADDLLNMIHSFWPKEANRKKRNGEYVVPLARFKDRIVEIDFSVTAGLPSRELFHSPGCILYLDPKSKLPMGIWEASRKRLFLPTEGRDWEHAKFYYRVNERAILATLHVIESHFGWSQAVATAAWQTLPVDHILRALLKPFTLNVHSVNWAAYHMLVREHSVLTHGSGFTTEGVVGAFMTFFRDFNYSQTFPESLEARRLHEVKEFDPQSLPLYSQGLRLYKVHHKFVEQVINLAYTTDEAMVMDYSVIRFWNHVNTYGRHLDPCVCGLQSDLFFDDNGVWPSFETKRTCKELLDIAGFNPSKNDVSRRRDWCAKVDPFSKVQAIRKLSDKACDANPNCNHLLYDVHYQRLDMSLPALKTREQLVNFLATFIWHVTAGHKFNSDNISYFADPDYSGVRMRDLDGEGQLPTRIDVGSYVFGSAIASLTTVRCPPLLADWRPLFAHFLSRQDHAMSDECRELHISTMERIHNEYKFSLFDLSRQFLDESSARPVNQRSNTMNPSTHASSVSV